MRSRQWRLGRRMAFAARHWVAAAPLRAFDTMHPYAIRVQCDQSASVGAYLQLPWQGCRSIVRCQQIVQHTDWQPPARRQARKQILLHAACYPLYPRHKLPMSIPLDHMQDAPRQTRQGAACKKAEPSPLQRNALVVKPWPRG